MQIDELSGNVLTLPPRVFEKLQQVQKELGSNDLYAALEKSLNIAHFVAETLEDPEKKLLIERKGKYQLLKGFA